MKWNSVNKKWYESKDYIYTKMGRAFNVKVGDLNRGSTALVSVQCDECGEILNKKWSDYLLYVREDGKYYCKDCALKLYNKERKLQAKLSKQKRQLKKDILLKNKSFYKWCYDNLSEEIADTIMLRWDDELNVDKNGNILTPKNVSYGSAGKNKKGYWFKCLDHPEHGSEQKRINSFTKSDISQRGSLSCSKCNFIETTHPELVKFLVNKEDATKYSHGSKTKLLMKCPNCNHEKKLGLNTLQRSGFGCPKCSDGIPYPEKFFYNFLEQLLNKEDFHTQLSKTIFEWCKNYRYDFYIHKIDCICETHGIQHYEEFKNVWKIKLDMIQENDRQKEQLAKDYGITNYIIIDTRKSELEWIKNNILIRNPDRPNQPSLAELLNFKESDIDWLKCHEFACNSLVKVVCDMWNDGTRSTTRIADIIKLHSSTISRYLKQGVKLGWCDYDPKEEKRLTLDLIHKLVSRKVICLTTEKIFHSITEAQNTYHIDGSSISKCCRNIKEYAGKHPNTNELMKWMYLEDYENMVKKEKECP